MITIIIFAKEIRKQILRIDKGKQDSFNFLGFIENKDLTDGVESYFREITLRGNWYNWVSGNRELQSILKKVDIKTKWQDIKKILK